MFKKLKHIKAIVDQLHQVTSSFCNDVIYSDRISPQGFHLLVFLIKKKQISTLFPSDDYFSDNLEFTVFSKDFIMNHGSVEKLSVLYSRKYLKKVFDQNMDTEDEK
jgi:hypothetical protein